MRSTHALAIAAISTGLLTAAAPGGGAASVRAAAEAHNAAAPAPTIPMIAAAAPRYALPGGTLAADTTRWVLDAEITQARYLVREQLAGLDLPNDAVGKTRNVYGTLTLADGQVVPAASKIEVDLGSLETDQSRRDSYVRRRTLVTDSFPMAVFVPTELRGVPVPFPTSGRHVFQMAGDLTVKGVTRPVVWEAEADFAEATVDGTARVAFPFTLFGLEKPRVGRVLSVADSIRLELDYRFRKAAGER